MVRWTNGSLQWLWQLAGRIQPTPISLHLSPDWIDATPYDPASTAHLLEVGENVPAARYPKL
jgi:hypothetical protein